MADRQPHRPRAEPSIRVATTVAEGGAGDVLPVWFERFMDDRQARKPSAHTMTAYRQDFRMIAPLLTAGEVGAVVPADMTLDAMRAAFAVYARDHEAASIRRC